MPRMPDACLSFSTALEQFLVQPVDLPIQAALSASLGDAVEGRKAAADLWH